MPEAATKTITAAQSIAGVMEIVGHVSKDGFNQQQNFNFRGIDAVMNAVGPALRQVGGFIKPDVEKTIYEHGVTGNGKATMEVRLRVRYSWYGTDGGDPITSVVVSEATDMSDKATAKAMSVAYRTYLLQILALPTTEKDPDEDYIDRGTGEARKPAARKPSTPKGPTKPSEDWWKLGAETTSADDLKAVFDRCSSLGELGLVCPYDKDAGTANQWLRDLKKKRYPVTPVETLPAESAPASPTWNVTQIPTAPEGGDAA